MEEFMKKLSLLLAAVVLVLALGACGLLLNYKSIELVGDIQTVYMVGDTLDLSTITLRATKPDGSTVEVQGNNPALKVTGFDTATPGEKTMRLSIGGAYVDIPYTVYSDLTIVKSEAELRAALAAKHKAIKINGTVTLTDKISAASDVTIIGAPGAKLIANQKIFDAATSNVTFADLRIVNGIQITAKEATLENCTVALEAGGATIRGIQYNTNRLVISNSRFVTDEVSCFSYVINAKKSASELVVKNTSVNCNFFYGLNVPNRFTIDGCEINSTVTTDSPFRDDDGASYLNPNKNPVAIHFPAAKTNTDYEIKANILNTKFSNVQNVLRIYYTDTYVSNGKFDFKWTNNDTSVNCNNIVNCSSQSYGTLATLQTAIGGDLKYRAVVEKNTAITGDIKLEKINSDGFYYSGAKYVAKDGSTPYDFLGWYKDNMYIKDDAGYYTLSVDYSADGLDIRTITPVTNEALINELNDFFSKA